MSTRYVHHIYHHPGCSCGESKFPFWEWIVAIVCICLFLQILPYIFAVIVICAIGWMLLKLIDRYF